MLTEPFELNPMIRNADVLVIPTWSGPLFSAYKGELGKYDHVLQLLQRGNGVCQLCIDKPVWLGGSLRGEGASVIETNLADACVTARRLANAVLAAGRSAIVVGHIPARTRWKYSLSGPPPDLGM